MRSISAMRGPESFSTSTVRDAVLEQQAQANAGAAPARRCSAIAAPHRRVHLAGKAQNALLLSFTAVAAST
jgi:hypothetical protein